MVVTKPLSFFRNSGFTFHIKAPRRRLTAVRKKNLFPNGQCVAITSFLRSWELWFKTFIVPSRAWGCKRKGVFYNSCRIASYIEVWWSPFQFDIFTGHLVYLFIQIAVTCVDRYYYGTKGMNYVNYVTLDEYEARNLNCVVQFPIKMGDDNLCCFVINNSFND